MSRQSSNPVVVSELRMIRVTRDNMSWDARIDAKAGTVRLRAWPQEQPRPAGPLLVDAKMPVEGAVGLYRCLRDDLGGTEVRPAPLSAMPRLGGPRRVDVGDVELRWSGGAADGDTVRVDAVDTASGATALAFELPSVQANVVKVMLRHMFKVAGGGPELSGAPR